MEYRVTFMVQRAHKYLAGDSACTVWDAERIESRDHLKMVTHRIAEEAAESYDGPAYALAFQEMDNGEILTNSPRYIVGYDPHTGRYMVPEDHFLYGPFRFIEEDELRQIRTEEFVPVGAGSMVGGTFVPAICASCEGGGYILAQYQSGQQSASIECPACGGTGDA